MSPVLHFIKSPWFHTQLEWNPDLKESKGLPAGHCSDICGQSASSCVFGTVHEWLHTVKVSLLDDHCLSNTRYAWWLTGFWGRCLETLSPHVHPGGGAEGTKSTVRFLSGRDQTKSWSLASLKSCQPGSQHSCSLALVVSLLPLCSLCLHQDARDGPIFFTVLCL